METWVAVFVIIAAVALVIQMAVFVGMYLQVRKANEQIMRILGTIESRLTPLLERTNALLDDSGGKLTAIVSDGAEIIHVARSQAQKFDRVFTEAVDRLRLQIIRADVMVTSALEAVEEAGTRFRKTVWGPMNEASALIQGVKTGLEFFRKGYRRSPNRSREEEGLFI